MDSKILELLKNPKYKNLSIIFDMLWAHEKGQDLKDSLFSNDEYEINIDFEELEEIALKRTPVEQIALFFKSIHESIWVTFSVIYIILMPTLIWLNYEWVTQKIITADIPQLIVILSILTSFCVLGILILVLISNKIIQMFQKPTKKGNFVVVRIKTAVVQTESYLSILSGCSIFLAVCLLAITVSTMVQKTSKIQNTLHLMDAYAEKQIVKINIQDNSPRFIKAEYIDSIKDIEKLKAALETPTNTKQKACIYNALGVAYEFQGDPKNASKAYAKSIYYDPDMVMFKINKEQLAQSNSNSSE